MELGVVVGAHGLRGELRVRWFGDGPENLLGLAGAGSVWLRAPGAEPPAAERRAVREARPGRAGEVRIRLEGVADRDAAGALRGTTLLAPAEALAPLGEDEFYWHELVGCRVEDQEGETIGRVVELWDTGAHDVLVVEAGDGRRHLIPTAREVMREVDVAARRIRVELVPGLLD